MSAMKYILDSDVEVQDRLGLSVCKDHVKVTGEYTSDSVAKFKLTWKAEQAIRRAYRGRVPFLTKPRFYCFDGRVAVELGRKEY